MTDKELQLDAYTELDALLISSDEFWQEILDGKHGERAKLGAEYLDAGKLKD